MTEIDYISIQRGGGEWVLHLRYTHGGLISAPLADPSQFLDETQRVLGPWIAEDRLIQAMYAIPPEPQSIRADYQELLDLAKGTTEENA